jgi:hypothetical protein
VAELPPPPNRKGGWYPDPEGSGRLRFWNKARWTDDFRDAPGGEAKPSGSGGSTAPGTPKKRGQWGGAPWWAWVLAAIVGIGIISAIAGGSSTKTVTRTQTHTQTQEVTVTAPQPTVTETTTVRVGG